MISPLGLAKSLGIMQVKAKENISDLESVDLGTAKIVSNLSKVLAELKIGPVEDKARGIMDPESSHAIWKIESYMRLLLNTTTLVTITGD